MKAEQWRSHIVTRITKEIITNVSQLFTNAGIRCAPSVIWTIAAFFSADKWELGRSRSRSGSWNLEIIKTSERGCLSTDWIPFTFHEKHPAIATVSVANRLGLRESVLCTGVHASCIADGHTGAKEKQKGKKLEHG